MQSTLKKEQRRWLNKISVGFIAVGFAGMLGALLTGIVLDWFFGGDSLKRGSFIIVLPWVLVGGFCIRAAYIRGLHDAEKQEEDRS